MIRHIPLYRSSNIEVSCTPIVFNAMKHKLENFVKSSIACEKTLIRSLRRSYPESKGKFYFVFKKNKNKDLLGNCDIDHYGDICIELNATQYISTLCKTISHEMVHARQFISGKLKYNNRIKYYTFEGDRHKYIYKNQPWEIEAYSLEHIGELRIKNWMKSHIDFIPRLMKE